MPDSATAENPTAGAAPAQEAAPAPAAPELVLDKGWSSESFGWSEDEEAGAGDEAKTPAAAAPASPEASAPAEEKKAEATQPEPPAAPAKPKLSEEEKRELMEDPDVRAEIDRRANSRFGNLKQQEDVRRQREAEEDSKFEQATDFYRTKFADLPAEERAKKLLDPQFRNWVTDYEAIAESRKSTRQQSADVQQVRAEVLAEGIQTWNVDAARAFGQHAATLIPFYKELPADLRNNLEAGSQADAQRTWVEEYVDGLSKGFMSWHRAQLSQHEQAIRNEMRAEGETQSPVMVKGDSNREPSAREILSIHALEGFSPERGVTEESLARAKKALNMEF